MKYVFAKPSRFGFSGQRKLMRSRKLRVDTVGLAPERILSLGYFAGRYDGFIPIQASANPERLFKRLRAAAWDLLLLRLPAQLPCERIEGQVTLGYVATSDNALRQAAEACIVEGVMALAPRVHVPLPLLSADVSKLEQLVGSKTVLEIKELDHSWDGSRMLARGIHPISHGELISVRTLKEVFR